MSLLLILASVSSTAGIYYYVSRWQLEAADTRMVDLAEVHGMALLMFRVYLL